MIGGGENVEITRKRRNASREKTRGGQEGQKRRRWPGIFALSSRARGLITGTRGVIFPPSPPPSTLSSAPSFRYRPSTFFLSEGSFSQPSLFSSSAALFALLECDRRRSSTTGQEEGGWSNGGEVCNQPPRRWWYIPLSILPRSHASRRCAVEEEQR